jgi:hypothetical protein
VPETAMSIGPAGVVATMPSGVTSEGVPAALIL